MDGSAATLHGLTVELMDVVDDGLKHRPATGLPAVQTHALGLFLIELENNREGYEDKGHDNGKGAVGPAPAGHGQERLGRQRAGKSGADERGAGKAKGERTVAKARRVRHEDVQDQVDGVVADPVQDISRGVTIGAVARSENDNAQKVDTYEEEKAFSTTPQIEGFGNRQLEDTTDDCRQDVGGIDSGSGLEVRVSVVEHVGANRLLQGQHKEAHPDPDRPVNW